MTTIMQMVQRKMTTRMSTVSIRSIHAVEATLIALREVDYDSDYEPVKGASGQGTSTADPYAGE